MADRLGLLALIKLPVVKPMKMLSSLIKIAKSAILFPELTLTDLVAGRTLRQSAEHFSRVDLFGSPLSAPVQAATNPLRSFFEARNEGRGIWKWDHYFEIYHRHLQKFVDKEIKFVEIGVYSGGSLEMWGEYFGPLCHIYGIDIEASTRAYESERVSIFVGDQADTRFWSDFKARVGSVDVLIDDGGHTPHQQRVTLREMLSMVRPGGVYICEDIHGHRNPFINDAAGLVHELNRDSSVAHGETLSTPANSVQAAVYSICFYPFMMVIEKNLVRRDSLLSRRKGTQWQPFYSEYPVDSE